jgi:hypothetical protein
MMVFAFFSRLRSWLNKAELSRWRVLFLAVKHVNDWTSKNLCFPFFFIGDMMMKKFHNLDLKSTQGNGSFELQIDLVGKNTNYSFSRTIQFLAAVANVSGSSVDPCTLEWNEWHMNGTSLLQAYQGSPMHN